EEGQPLRSRAGVGRARARMRRALPAIAAALATAPLFAQQRRSAPVTRTGTAPVIDGRLDDEVWRQATPIGDLVQIEPVAGTPPTEKTEVRILYDDDHLYLGIRCFDDEPSGIIGTQMGRDADLDTDDRVEIVIDTFHDRRNAFFFQMNPVGSKGDALI